MRIIFYYAIDGDNIGARFEKHALSNEVDLIINFSNTVKELLFNIKKFFEQNGAHVVFCEGDSILVFSERRIDIDKKLLFYNEITFSMGIGNTCSDATLALKKAKGLGKKRIEELIYES